MNRITTRRPGQLKLAYCRSHLWLPLVLMTVAQSAIAQNYTTIDCPGSLETTARGINDRGDVVGHCLLDDETETHGFLFRNGVFKMIDVPNAVSTQAYSINNWGEVVGQYWDNEEVLHGYRLWHGRFTTIDPPGSLETSVRGIDDLGRVVGYYLGTDEVYRGYILDRHGYRDIEFPEAESTAAFDINIRSQLVGGYIDTSGVPHGFLLVKGVFRSIHPPGAAGARAFGINGFGHIIGGWTDDVECPDCFVNAFLLTPQGFEFFEFPDALETVAYAINVRGQIVGSYYSEDETFHGFVRDRGNEPTESPEANSLIHTTPTGGAQLAASEVTTNIQNKGGPAGGFSFNPLDWWFSHPFEEANRVISVPIYRTGGSTGAVSVQYDMTSASASAGIDYLVTPATLTWADGEVGSKRIRVELLQDSVLEGTECFTIQLSRPTGGAVISLSHSKYRICITDDELGFRLHNSTATVIEDGDSVTLAVARMGAATGTASVNYATESGLATTGSDFTAANGTLDWADGDSTSRDIVINIANDTLDESDETFTVALSNPSAGMGLATAVATVTITDDDDDGPRVGGGGGAFDWLTAVLLGGLMLARRQCGRVERCRTIRSELRVVT